MSLVIIGCGLGRDDLTAKMHERIMSARVLAGGRRLLDWFPDHLAEKVVLDASARNKARELLERAASQAVVVLASGDPLFFGIAATFLKIADESEKKLETCTAIEIMPNVSAVQAACARAGISWSGLEFFNLHGRGSLAWRRILRASEGALILAGPEEKSPGRLAALLVARFPEASQRKAIVFANLGCKDEVLLYDSLGALAGGDFPSLSLLYIAPAAQAREIPAPAWGLPVSEYAHEAGLITKAEIRAVLLAKLQLVPGVFWDLGAGSGSVAVEAAFMQSGLKVYAVEKNESRAGLIRANALMQGVMEGVEIVVGDISEVMADLPDPDRVFLGGGGDRIGEIAESAFARLSPGGILAAAAVTLESRARLSEVLKDHCDEVVEINISRSHRLNGLRLLKSENPIGLFIFRKGE
jgi:precorrin-6Y C5,15-methyltransferase (decarboxylating)